MKKTMPLFESDTPGGLALILQGTLIDVARLQLRTGMPVEAKRTIGRVIVRNLIRDLKGWLGEGPIPQVDPETLAISREPLQ